MKLINRLFAVTLAAAVVASPCLGMNNQVCCINNIANFITPLSNTCPSFGFNNKNAFTLNKLQATKQDGSLATNVNAKVKELAQSFGHKSANLEILQSYVANDKNLSTLLQLTGITVGVPEFQPISNNEILGMLKTGGCDVEKELGSIAKAFQNQADVSIKNKALPKEMLNKFVALGEKIEKTCNDLASVKICPNTCSSIFSYASWLYPGNWFAEQTVAKKIEAFITDVKKIDSNTRLMVRSTGGGEDTESKEDGKTGGSNAGGNETAVNVKPTISDVLKAIGYVLKSYFSEKSLNQRIAAGDKSLFSEKAFVPVLLQRMIGEKQGGTDNKEKIPTSCVVYVTKAGSSRVTTQCTKGHGEAVVNSMLPVDTTDSDDAYKSLKNSVISKKSVRLVPDKKGLVLQKNPTEIISKSSIDKNAGMAIDLIALHIEKLYGKSMDIELVYDPVTKTVWLVQTRPLNLPEAKPSFIENLGQIDNQKKLAIDSTVVGGNNSVIHIDNKKQVICAKTLDDALETFNMMQERTNVKLVIVDDQNASSTSHAAAIFRENSIIVVVGNTQEATSWLEKENVSLYVDPQQEAIVWATNKEASIKDGYCSYPMPLKLSVPNIQEQKNKEKNDCTIKPQEQTLEQLVTTIKSGAQKEATQAYKDILCRLQGTKDGIQANLSLPQTFVNIIKNKALEKKITTKLSTNAAKKLKRLQLYAQELADDVMQATTQKPYSLERLYPIRILESILFQKENNGLVCAISYYNVLNRYHDNKEFVTTTIARLIKENKLTQDTPIVTSEKNIAVARTGFDASITDDQADAWLIFLDYALTNKPAELNTLLETLNTLDIFSAWLSTEFYTATKKYDVQNQFKQLYQQIQTDEKSLRYLLDKKQLITTIPTELIAQPDKFEKVLKIVDAVLKEFTSNEFMELAAKKDNSPLATIALINTINAFVTTFDTTIKNLKSPLYTDKNKLIQNFKIILQKYFDLMWAWKNGVPQQALQYHPSWPFDTYFDQLKTLFDQIKTQNNLTEATLLPSQNFSVAAAVIGAVTDFSRHYPQTLEDLFTTIHQNIIVFTCSILKTVVSTSTLPTTSLAQNVETALKNNPNVQESGIVFSESTITKSYNLPLNNHSAGFTIEFSKTETLFTIIFKGDSALHNNRWQIMQNYIHDLATARDISITDFKINNNEIVATFTLSDKSNIKQFATDIQFYIAIANQNGSLNRNNFSQHLRLLISETSKLKLQNFMSLYSKIIEKRITNINNNINFDDVKDMLLDLINNLNSVPSPEVSIEKIKNLIEKLPLGDGLEIAHQLFNTNKTKYADWFKPFCIKAIDYIENCNINNNNDKTRNGMLSFFIINLNSIPPSVGIDPEKIKPVIEKLYSANQNYGLDKATQLFNTDKAKYADWFISFCIKDIENRINKKEPHSYSANHALEKLINNFNSIQSSVGIDTEKIKTAIEKFYSAAGWYGFPRITQLFKTNPTEYAPWIRELIKKETSDYMKEELRKILEEAGFKE